MIKKFISIKSIYHLKQNTSILGVPSSADKSTVCSTLLVDPHLSKDLQCVSRTAASLSRARPTSCLLTLTVAGNINSPGYYFLVEKN
jgi:hypothetical protein